MLKRCEDTKLALNWEKSHFMVKEGIVLGHKISRKGIEVDKAKVDKLTEAPILIAPNWDQPFEIMCDASDYAIGAVLGQRIEKHFRPIHYASKTMTEAETNYTTTEKEMLAVVYAFEKFRSYLIMNNVMFTCLSIPRELKTMQPITFSIDLKTLYENVFDPKEITETFPLESLKCCDFLMMNKIQPTQGLGLPIKQITTGEFFFIKGMTSQRKRSFSKIPKAVTFWDDPYLFWKHEMCGTESVREDKGNYTIPKIKNRIVTMLGESSLAFQLPIKKNFAFSGKLKSRWSGPFTITEVYPYGTAKLSHADGSNFKVNCHRLKHYYGGDTPPLVIPDLQTFPKDN
ncbi:reverse transcriptase domain-containing protein [Tanacetum coccineum]